MMGMHVCRVMNSYGDFVLVLILSWVNRCGVLMDQAKRINDIGFMESGTVFVLINTCESSSVDIFSIHINLIIVYTLQQSHR